MYVIAALLDDLLQEILGTYVLEEMRISLIRHVIVEVIKVHCQKRVYRVDLGIVRGEYHVDLKQRTYNCRSFDTLGFQCAHASAACSNQRLDHMSFVDEVYKLEHMYNAWRNVFPLVLDECMWPPISNAPFKLLSDRSLRRKPKDRSTSTQIRNNIDIQEKSNQRRLCEWCRNLGYTMSSCPDQRDDIRTTHH
ncbi:hypothetical protein J1N35_022549 [Gossypium stocksii]|uniref:SWIM-type domain-containing protein n=1 Tax=Gossypium stocksii TaxID=47602 RepID=A0A9D3VGY6_9ROSI|nr:hypothetical protein J1N35_022549 [Gossypium stocksii]